MGKLGSHLRESIRAFAAVFRNANLRRLQGGWAASTIGHWALLVAVSVYAYSQGGEAAVGLIFLFRLVPAGILAPFAGVLADRHRRERVMFWSALLRCGLAAGAAIAVATDAPSAFVYVPAIIAAIANAPFRSAQAALMPTLAATPSELTAANAVSSTIESVAFFAGPMLAGMLLAGSGIKTVLVLTAVMFALAAFFALRLRVQRVEAPKEVEASTIFSECLAGFRVVLRHRELRVLIGLFTAQTFVAGLMLAELVTVAIELLDIGEAG